jgi:hypothetical protein
MRYDRENRIKSEILVGYCPECGSNNTHDCEAREYVRGLPVGPKRVIMTGSTCEIARVLDANDIGHCDDCGCLWCTLCETVVQSNETLDKLPSLVSEHRDVCGVKDRTIRIWRDSAIPTRCLMCGSEVEDYYVAHPLGGKVMEILSEALKIDVEDFNPICSRCLPRFESKATDAGLNLEEDKLGKSK